MAEKVGMQHLSSVSAFLLIMWLCLLISTHTHMNTHSHTHMHTCTHKQTQTHTCTNIHPNDGGIRVEAGPAFYSVRYIS